jgi:hypothetical protein
MKIIKTAASEELLKKMASEDKDSTSSKEKEDFADEPLIRMYTNWLKDGNSYQPVGDVSVEEELLRSAYRVRIDPYRGLFFDRVKPKTAELYKFKSGPMEEVLSEIDKFWDLKEDYKKLGLLYCRGVLLYGPPGSGKTSIVNQVVDMITKRGDIVVYSNDVHAVREGLKSLRSVEPDRKLVVILEDADEQIRYNEQSFLHLLDGQDSQDGVLFLASTNYIERFPARLLRSGRFDKKIEVPQPPYEGRLAYLKNKLIPHKMETEARCEKLAEDTDGFSFGDMLELVTAVYALKEDEKEVLARLRKSAGLEEMIQERDESVMALPMGGGMPSPIGMEMKQMKQTTPGIVSDAGSKRAVKTASKEPLSTANWYTHPDGPTRNASNRASQSPRLTPDQMIPNSHSIGGGKNAFGAGIDLEFLKNELLKQEASKKDE